MLAGVAVIVLGTIGLVLHGKLVREFERANLQEINGKIDVVRHYLEDVVESKDLLSLRHHLDDVLIGSGQLRIWIVTANGLVIYGGKEPPRMRPRDDGLLTVWREDGVPLIGQRVQVPASTVVPAADLVVGVDTRESQRLLRRFGSLVFLACSLGVALTICLSTWVVHRALQPVRRLSEQAAQLDPTRLSVRLSTQGVATELCTLVLSFNSALERVERSYRQLEGFSADVAHELRTPLATLISGTEVALSRPRSTAELHDILASNLEELRQLSSMVNDLLFLARADRGEIVENGKTVELAEEARQVADYFEATLEERGQTLKVVGNARTTINTALMRRAVANLISNATRFTPAQGLITIKLGTDEEFARVSVSNPGPQIPADALPRLFERFYRADSSRTDSSEHHGLGLAIVHGIARMHNGDVFATSENGITEIGFTVKRH